MNLKNHGHVSAIEQSGEQLKEQYRGNRVDLALCIVMIVLILENSWATFRARSLRIFVVRDFKFCNENRHTGGILSNLLLLFKCWLKGLCFCNRINTTYNLNILAVLIMVADKSNFQFVKFGNVLIASYGLAFFLLIWVKNSI